jgi:7-keto-8-aminopelargonate synthetase-like enzyme
LGSFGAYAAIPLELRELLVNRARSFIFSTSLPPAVLGASIAALELVQSLEGKALREKLLANSSLFRDLLRDAGFSTGNGITPIVPLMSTDAELTMQFSEMLLEEGIFAQGIRPPTVPAGACRLRCTVMATHTTEQLIWAVDRIKFVGRRLGIV